MGVQGIVVQPGEGPVSSFTPGRSIVMKLLCGQTADSIMIFEETVPTGTNSTFHLHHDSDEVAYVLTGEVTFLIGKEVTVGGPGAVALMPRGVPHAWKSTGAETGRMLFLYTPAKAGGLVEEQQRTGRKFASMSEREMAELLDRHGLEDRRPVAALRARRRGPGCKPQARGRSIRYVLYRRVLQPPPE